MKNMLHNIKVQLKTNLIRNDTLDGKTYKVVPMVMLVEGVHEGSAGAYLYTEDALSKQPHVWNMKPVVVYHPDSDTACTKEIIENRGIGHIMNARYDEGLKADAWIDPDKLKAVDKKIGNKISKAMEKGEMLELSTGLFADSDETPGEWGEKKEKYKGTLSNIGPDHLAVLPDQKGACSISDGAGFIRNAEGNRIDLSKSWVQYFENLGVNNLRQQLNHLIARDKEYRWVEDIDPDTKTFIWSDEKSIHRQSYKVDADVVALNGDPEEVVRVVTYKPKNKVTRNSERNDAMDKKAKIDALIANKATKWEESDREYLNSLDEKVLDKMAPKEVKNEEKKEPTKVENKDTKTDEHQMTDEEWMNKLPPKARERFENMEKREQEQRKKLIAKITKNAEGRKTKFSEAFLNKMGLDDLEALAVATAPVQNEDDGEHLFADYGGQGDPVEIDNEGGDMPVLNVPKMNFQKTQAKTA